VRGKAHFTILPLLTAFAGLSIRRSSDPYKISSKKLHSLPRVSSSPSSSAIPHISLHIAASSSGKGRKFQPNENTRDYKPDIEGPLGLQKGSIQEARRNRPDSGQDAYFVAKVGQSFNTTAFGIADGVGGWTNHGVDPADFSHGLCSYMAQVAMEWSSEKLGPRELLEAGYKLTINDPDIRAGGSTACVAVTGNDGRMHIANLGDSGFLQLRLGAVHHYSNPQTHAFNTPYQMSITPPEILRQARIFGGLPLNDRPDRADIADHMLRHGDVTVIATDGVWDNLTSQDVLNIVSKDMRALGAWQRTAETGYIVSDKIAGLVDPKLTSERTLQSVIAAAIVREAKSASMNIKRDGPYAKAVQREVPWERYQGGKVDDISVLAIVSVDNTKLPGQISAKL
jgi:protein phosphatase PTC7